jgi:hypothetical protein
MHDYCSTLLVRANRGAAMNDREWLATVGEYSSRLRLLAGAIMERVTTILAHDRSTLLADIQRLDRQVRDLQQRVRDLEEAVRGRTTGGNGLHE